MLTRSIPKYNQINLIDLTLAICDATQYTPHSRPTEEREFVRCCKSSLCPMRVRAKPADAGQDGVPLEYRRFYETFGRFGYRRAICNRIPQGEPLVGCTAFP